jgi:hypothetical protein
VFDVNQIVLCCVCAENPMTKDQESIAAGNSYGQLGSLKLLNGTTQNEFVYKFDYTMSICKYKQIILQTILLHFQ